MQNVITNAQIKISFTNYSILLNIPVWIFSKEDIKIKRLPKIIKTSI